MSLYEKAAIKYGKHDCLFCGRVTFKKQVCDSVNVCVCALPAASGVVLFHVFDEVDLFGVSRSWRATREVSGPI